jgi:hypothetical protein
MAGADLKVQFFREAMKRDITSDIGYKNFLSEIGVHQRGGRHFFLELRFIRHIL